MDVAPHISICETFHPLNANPVSKDAEFRPHSGQNIFFETLKIASGPVEHKRFCTRTNKKREVFPIGFTINGENMILAYGQNDNSVRLAVLDGRRVLHALKPV